MMPSSLSAAMLLLAASTKTAVASETNIEVVERRFPKAGDLCVSQSKTFTVSVDLYAGELGSYVLEECGDHLWNPTIAMEIGETYTFVQKHRTNYYHPLGIAYSPYGDEEVKTEAEPGISLGDPTCIATKTCPAPMYHLNGEYLGKYSNMPGNSTIGEDDFGLDVYEPLFFRDPHEWTSFGNFTVQLRIDDATIKNDLFYFCHIHEFMGGRIKLTKNGMLLNELDAPDLGYEYDTMSDFDKMCGTFGLGDFELPNPHCPDRFVCMDDGASQELQQFSLCIDAMNCHMMAGMTTGIQALDARALFVHQMIPHHQNAANMAKSLLKTGLIHCDDLSKKDDNDCQLEAILLEIIAQQNLQIQGMYDFLDSKRLPEKDNCDVYVETLDEPSIIFQEKANHQHASSSMKTTTRTAEWVIATVLGLVLVVVGA